MCFSSTASFTAAGLLLPVGIQALRLCPSELRAQRLPLALCPLLFGLQQGLEGLVWLGLEPGRPPWLPQGAALAYLFFAYAFWLAWMPWCALRFAGGGAAAGAGARAAAGGEPQGAALALAWQRGLLLLGLLMGLSLWLPLLLDPSQLQPQAWHGNLIYPSDPPLLPLLGAGQGSLLYGLLVSLPLLLCLSRRLRLFAAALLLSFALAWFGYRHAFVSSWCFFSALLSPLLLWAVAEPEPLSHPAAARWRHRGPPSPGPGGGPAQNSPPPPAPAPPAAATAPRPG